MSAPRSLPAHTPEPSGSQRRSAVYRHPRHEEIEQLLAIHTPGWVAAWLRECYPTQDAWTGARHPDATRNERLRISARAIEKYRDRFLPEYRVGADVIPEELEDMLGRRPPAAPRHELERLERLQDAALLNLRRAMTYDEKNKETSMVRPLTLSAQDSAAKLAIASIEVKSKLGIPGYEAVATKFDIDATTRNLGIHLHGRIDPQTGEPVPNDPARVDAMREVLALGPERILDAVTAARERVVDTDAIEDE